MKTSYNPKTRISFYYITIFIYINIYLAHKTMFLYEMSFPNSPLAYINNIYIYRASLTFDEIYIYIYVY